MVHPNIKFLRAIGTLIGGMIGVGVFGLPYAFAQAGFILGALIFIVVGLLVGILMLMYGQIVIEARGRHRLVGHVKHYLGERWSWITAVTHTVSLWGAMLAYIIVGGHFLYILIGPIFGGPETVYALIMAISASALIYRGLKFVSQIEVFIVITLLFLFVFIIILGFFYSTPANLTGFDWSNFFVPYGVTLFAFGGLGVIPEMRDVLGQQRNRLLQALYIGLTIVGVLYLLFALAVVGVTGGNTSEMALNGLIPIFGAGFGVITAFLGSLTILSIFTILGIELLDLLKFDYHLKHQQAWALTMFVPIILFILGLREFIDLVGFIGAVFSAALGMIVVIVYEKMKKSRASQKNGFLNIPTPVSAIIICIFIIGALVEIFSRLN